MPVRGRGAHPAEPPQAPGPRLSSRRARSPAEVTESPGMPGAGPRFPPGSDPAAAGAGGCAAPERGLSPRHSPRKSRTSGNAPRDFPAIFLSCIFNFNFILNNKRKPCSQDSAASFSVYGLKDNLKIPLFSASLSAAKDLIRHLSRLSQAPPFLGDPLNPGLGGCSTSGCAMKERF